MIAALLFLTIRCVEGDFERADARVTYESGLALVAVETEPDLRTTTRHRLDDLSVHAGDRLVGSDGEPPERALLLYVSDGGRWWQLRDRGKLPVIEERWQVNGGQPPQPIVVDRVRPRLVRVTYAGLWRGVNSDGRKTRTMLLDFTRAQPRIAVAIDCDEAGAGGACGAPNAAHAPHTELTCDETLRCTSTERLRTDWATRTATRSFHLLTNETIAPRRFDAVTYRSGDAFARAFHADRGAIRQRTLIEHVGVVEPLFELSRNEVLLAAPPRVESVAVRFFLLSRNPARWREIPLTRLSDDGYPATPRGEAVLARDHTPEPSPLQFRTFDLELKGNARLLEVLAQEGESRAIYWIMLDRAGRTGALRVATDTPEWRHCGSVIFPPSATALGIPQDGLPAVVEAIHSWQRLDLDQGTLPKRCDTIGTIDWSAAGGWIVDLHERPCTDPAPRPFAATITGDGWIGVQRCEPLPHTGPDFAPPAERCAPRP